MEVGERLIYIVRVIIHRVSPSTLVAVWDSANLNHTQCYSLWVEVGGAYFYHTLCLQGCP